MKKKKKINKNAFTLVELIVVILVLAILSTIAFISYFSYNATSRDSTRKADLKNMTTVLELYKIDKGTLPIPSNGTGVTFSGANLWIQGTFGTSIIRIIGNMTSIPLDPKTGNEYSYSISNTKKTYEIGSILEQNATSFSPVENTYAADTYNSFVVGTYNGKLSKVLTGSTLHLVAVPSILTTDLNLTTYEAIVSANKLVYNAKKNLPYSYKLSGLELNGESGTMVNSSDYILISTAPSYTKNYFSSTELIQIGQKANASYTGTILSSEAKIKFITSVDTADNTETEALGQSLIDTVFK